MNEKFTSLDETIRQIREDCEHEVKTAQDKAIAAEIEAQICKDLLAKANEAKDLYMRIAERLITQFSTVEKVFAEAKAYALTVPQESAKRTELQPNEFESTEADA